MKSTLSLIILFFIINSCVNEKKYSIRNITINKQLFLKAPDHIAVYAQSFYGGDRKLFQTIRHEARKPANAYEGGMSYYSPTIYCRVSNDNGKNWSIFDKYYEDPNNFIGEHKWAKDFLFDKTNNLLIASWIQFTYDPDLLHKETFSDAGTYSFTKRTFYELSFDNGDTWTAPKQLIASGSKFNEVDWGPGLSYGKSGGNSLLGRGLEHKGTVYIPFSVNLHDRNRYQTAIVRGKWNQDQKDYEWHFSEYITLTSKQSSQGAVESQLIRLDNDDFFIIMRACGDRENKTFPTYKYFSYSNDNCRSFSDPKILTYEDGSPLWSPSSYCAIIRSCINKKYYFIANILDSPTYSSYPRDPLCIAEIIPEKGIVLKNTVQVIDTNKEPEVERRRYTNFGIYEDKLTKEIVLTLPEQPKISWADMTADCYEYRINIDQ